jgi:aryl-alcohol dehydrogenase-like predicted oxidoreductase
LGKTGIRVSAVGLGAMPLSLAGRPSESDAVRVIHAALDAGITLVDTADVYCLDHRDIGHNEQLIARALGEWSGPRREILVATKGGLERPRGDWTVNAHPKHLKEACEASLKALGVDAIALYQLHAPDDAVPFGDSVGALAELAREGKILHVGLSNVNVEQIEAASRIVSVVSVQNRCNPFERHALANGVVRACAEKGITFLAHSPVGGHGSQARTERHPTLASVGARHGLSPHQVCIAWLLASSPAVVPIPGASRSKSVLSSVAAAAAALDGDDLAILARAFPT